MTPQDLEKIDREIEHREHRQLLVARLWVVSTIILVLGVAYSLYADVQQSDDIREVGICASAPNSQECADNHAISVSKTTPAEACFILAQGGYRCRDPLPEAEVYQQRLVKKTTVDDIHYEAVPSNSSTGYVAPETSAPSSPSDPPGQSVPAPRPPVAPPSTPEPPKTPSQPSPVAPSPADPQPTTVSPLVNTPNALGVCVNALGVAVVC